MSFPDWQRLAGRALGPGDYLQGYPVRLVKPVYIAPDTNSAHGAIMYDESTFEITNPAGQVFQVVPNGYFDTVWLGAADVDALQYLRIGIGKITSPGLQNLIPPSQPDVIHFQSTQGVYWAKFQLPFGNTPFFVYCVKPSGAAPGSNPTLVRLALLTVGRRLSDYCGECPATSSSPFPPFTAQFIDTFGRNPNTNLQGPVSTGQYWDGFATPAAFVDFSNNQFHWTGVIAQVGHCWYVTPSADGFIRARVVLINSPTFGSSTWSLTNRWSSTGDNWQFSIVTGPSGIPQAYRLAKTVANTQTICGYAADANGAIIAPQNGDIFELWAWNDWVGGYVNGQLGILVADRNGISGNTAKGFYGGNRDATIADIQIGW